MSLVKLLTVPVVVAGLLLGGITAAQAADDPTPQLVEIRAAQHDGYDRLVFEFAGGIPQAWDVEYVDQVIADGSGQPIRLSGNAFLQVHFNQAVGHDDDGNITYGASRRAYALPTIFEVANAGDFEAHLTFGVGMAAERPYTVFFLRNPGRIVIDIDNSFTTIQVKDYFFQSGILTTVAVTRPVIPPATGKGALQRLFAGPTEAELAAGLRFINSDATGFTGLTISGGVARVRLTGGCNSHGGTATIAGEIFATLKQFSSVKWVKIYDPSGATEQPSGNSDSIPECLEP